MSTNVGPGAQAETLIPVVHWPRSPYVKWVVAGFMMLWILMLWFISRQTSFFWAGTFWMVLLPMQLVAAAADVRTVISGGVFCRVRANGSIERVPLATLPFLPDYVTPRYLLMLSGVHLWVLTPTEAPHPIALTAVRDIIDGSNTATIRTHDATYPEMRLTRQHSLDVIMKLKTAGIR